MQSDLKPLTITAKELEQLTEFEVNDLFIGGMIGGAYRPGSFKTSKRLLSFCLMQLFVLMLTFIFTLPFGLAAIRNNADVVNDLPTVTRFFQVTVGITIGVVVSWNVAMSFKGKTIKALATLLDEVDKYNDVVQAVDIVDRLEAIGNTQAHMRHRHQAIEALAIARNSLVCGLMTEKILRQHRTLLSRRADLLTNIEVNLATLRTLETNNQANEYVELLNEALQIGISVYKEVQQLSQP